MTDRTYPVPPHGWTCFHCNEVFTTRETALEHFGPMPISDPLCIDLIKREDFRGVVMELRKLKTELETLRREVADEITCDKYFYSRLRSSLQTITPFKDCISLHDVFNLYDSMEGRALAAENLLTEQQR